MAVEDLHPWFVGAYGENHKILEELVLDLLRDHIFWRRNFHPESVPPIPTSAQVREDYSDFVARLRHELFRLGADLKQSVPFFSPRYIGHMASDLLLPGLIARIATELYNPNNVTEDVAPVTLKLERLVGEQLAVMLGYNLDGEIRAFGHLTSGGTVANYEGLQNLIAARMYPLAAAAAVRELGASIEWRGRPLADVPPIELAHFSVEQSVELHRSAAAQARQLGVLDWPAAVQSQRYETLGLVEFHRRHPEIGTPRVMVAATGHYSWAKAMKLLGLGTAQLQHVGTDGAMRLDAGALDSELRSARERGDVVLAVVPILGNTEFGAIDPVHRVVALRNQYRGSGFEFGIHVDAAWGGYLRALFKAPDGELRPRADVAAQFRYFPGTEVYDAFMAVARTDSATVDPHKLGFIPYSAGAYIARNRNIVDFVRQDAAYVFEQVVDDDESRFRDIGRYSLEGSKSGAAAASAFVTHRTIPLHSEGFGKIVAQSVRSCEAFWDRSKVAARAVEDLVHLVVPFEPDTNLVCLALNRRGNTSIASANAFMREVMSEMKADSTEPVQDRQFFVSSTTLFDGDIVSAPARRTLAALGLDPESTGEEGADHILVMRHTLMNPWLLSTDGGKTYIERYFEFLEQRLRDLCAAG